MRVVVPPKDEMRPKPVTPAQYRFLYMKHTFTMASTGKPMLYITYEIKSNGPNPDEVTIGRKFTEGYVMQEEMMWKLNGIHVAATGEDIPSQECDIEELINYVIGRVRNVEMSGQLIIDNYGGSPSNKIKGHPVAVTP